MSGSITHDINLKVLKKSFIERYITQFDFTYFSFKIYLICKFFELNISVILV